MKEYFDYIKEIHLLKTRKDFVEYAKELSKAYNDIDCCEFALLKLELFHMFENKGFKETETFNFGNVCLGIPEESKENKKMKTYIVTIQIYKNKEKYTKATFEIEAKDENSAKYRVVSLLSEETRNDGDGYEILEVRG